MIMAKNGKLVCLCKDDQALVLEAYYNGGENIVYHTSYAKMKKAHVLLITDANGKEVCALISKDVTRIVALTGDELISDGMPLSKFICKYCPDY